MTKKYLFFFFIVMMLSVECLYFLCQPRRTLLNGKIDVLVVFQGVEARTASAYQLMHDAEVSNFFVPGATQAVIHAKNIKYGIPDSVMHIPSHRRTLNTFEDALATSEVIRRLHVRRVVLVTSDYHIPRSLLLLRLQCLDCNTKIIPFGIRSQISALALVKRHINEMIKLWGSLVQMSYFNCTGKLLSSSPQVSRLYDRLEAWLTL